ncbi:uncharacterized protein [Penaeus vannamei]|uniref:uncharacterized protein n=1 Tax=Penaeus vannamei TaxID=6689 RepID=UPI00387F4991
MAAALLPGLLLLALSLGFPLASAENRALPRNLPSIMFLKPGQWSTSVIFKVLFEDAGVQNASFSLNMQWYAVELSRNENKTVVLRFPPLSGKEFSCCTGKELLNYHASYEGDIEWSEACPEDAPEDLLALCPTTESTSDTSDQRPPESSFSPAPRHQNSTSTASDSGNSTTKTEDLDAETKKILWIALPTGIGLLLVLVVALVCFLYTKSREYQPPTDVSYPARSRFDNGVASEEEDTV